MKKYFLWLLRIVAAAIMLQTLYFKFTGSAESVYLFTQLNMEPWGRIGIGILELIASVLILIPATSVWGGLLGIGLMSGAIFFHITRLGIKVQNDGGLLFFYAIIVMTASLFLVFMQHKQIIQAIKKISK